MNKIQQPILSLLTFNPSSIRRGALLADLYQTHRTVMSGFPEKLPDGERVLYRQEEDHYTGVVNLYVQSLTQPDWSSLQDSSCLLSPNSLSGRKNPDTKLAPLDFNIGDYLYFRLCANPTYMPVDSKKRIPLKKQRDQYDWLQRQAKRYGFDLTNELHIQEGGNRVGFKPRGNGKHRRIVVYTVTFNGVIAVVNPDRLREAICSGIGRAKGFGCGLLSVIKA